MFEFTPRKFFFSKNPTPWLKLRMVGNNFFPVCTIQNFSAFLDGRLPIKIPCLPSKKTSVKTLKNKMQKRCCFVSPHCENGDELEFLSNLPSTYVYYGFNFTGSDERKAFLESKHIFISRDPYHTICDTCDYILVSNQMNNFKSFVSQTSNTPMEVYNLRKEKRVKKI